jgi:hypothetical protein
MKTNEKGDDETRPSMEIAGRQHIAMPEAEAPGPGVQTYEEVARMLPDNYKPLQSPMRRMEALYAY